MLLHHRQGGVEDDHDRDQQRFERDAARPAVDVTRQVEDQRDERR
jgi:hypothetical protein